MSAQTQSRRGSETFEQAGRQSQYGRSCAIQDGLVSPEQTKGPRAAEQKGPERSQWLLVLEILCGDSD